MPPDPLISILFLAYPSFNTLDINGPLDVFGNVALSDTPFKLTIAAKDDLTTSVEGAILKRHISFDEALVSLADYDILVPPGGTDILPHLEPNDGSFDELLAVIQEFALLGDSPKLGGKRIIMSVCTGALFAGYAGIFAGIEATSHFLALDDLRTVCQGYNIRNPGSKPTDVIPKVPSQDFRYVKEQYTPTRMTRVISSGGISCGIDASLYLVELLKGRDIALKVANMMQYAWREMKGGY